MSITLIYVILAIIQALFMLRFARDIFKHEPLFSFFMLTMFAPIVTAILIFAILEYILKLVIGKDTE
jgi:hypothetical protein